LITTALNELGQQVQRNMSDMGDANGRIFDTLKETRAKITSQTSDISESIQKFDEKNLVLHEANKASTDALSDRMRQLSSTVEHGIETAKGNVDSFATTLNEFGDKIRCDMSELSDLSKGIFDTLKKTDKKIASHASDISKSM